MLKVFKLFITTQEFNCSVTIQYSIILSFYLYFIKLSTILTVSSLKNLDIGMTIKK